MSEKKQSVLQVAHRLVSPLCSEYFRIAWQDYTGLSRKQFYNRLKNPTIEDVLLFCHVCHFDEFEIFRPLKKSFHNIPPFNSNHQLMIEP